MFRTTITALFIALLASPALAGAPTESETQEAKRSKVEYRNSYERIQGAPYARAAQRRIAAHPVEGTSAAEAAMEIVPQANYLLEGTYGVPSVGGF